MSALFPRPKNQYPQKTKPFHFPKKSTNGIWSFSPTVRLSRDHLSFFRCTVARTYTGAMEILTFCTSFNLYCKTADQSKFNAMQGRNHEKRYRIVASSNARHKLKNQLFVKRSQYIRIENLLHKRSEKTCICF